VWRKRRYKGNHWDQGEKYLNRGNKTNSCAQFTGNEEKGLSGYLVKRGTEKNVTTQKGGIG